MPLSNSAQLLIKVLDQERWFEKILLALPMEAGLEMAFERFAPKVQSWYHDAATFSPSETRASFGVAPPPGPFQAAFLFLPKSKQYQTFALQLLAPALLAQGSIFVVGPKDGGAGSASGLIEAAGLKIVSKHSGKHCVLWRCQTGTAVALAPAYPYAHFEASGWGHTLKIATLPGVFSHGRFDVGTEYFIKVLQEQALTFGSALDWGCGAGVLGSLLSKLAPAAKITLVDINALAIESSRETIRINQLKGIEVVVSDGFAGLENESFDLIVSNPPAHKGFDSDLGATKNFLKNAPARLSNKGRLFIVANAHLPYGDEMRKSFKTVTAIASARGFTIWRGEK